jgi:hypothetical protein
MLGLDKHLVEAVGDANDFLEGRTVLEASSNFPEGFFSVLSVGALLVWRSMCGSR